MDPVSPGSFRRTASTSSLPYTSWQWDAQKDHRGFSAASRSAPSGSPGRTSAPIYTPPHSPQFLPLGSSVRASSSSALRRDADILVHVCTEQPIERNKPLLVECQLSAAAKTEVKVPLQPGSKGIKKTAYLVALDAASLKAQGSGFGLDPVGAAKRKLLAERCQCAPKVKLAEDGRQAFSIRLNPPLPPPSNLAVGSAVVLLQVVVESNILRTQWIPFGMPALV